MADDKKLHSITITHGGALLLKEILPSRGWDEKVSLKEAMRAVDVVENHLCSLKAPKGKPRPQNYKTVEEAESAQAEAEAEMEAQDKWARAKILYELTEGERAACKACLKFYAEKHALEKTIHVKTLCVEFGLLED